MSFPIHRDTPIPNVLTIAGSDPSGGAGIQADLKTFAAYRVYGCAVLTALTAQNTCTVSAVHLPPPDFVRQQLETLFSDVAISAIKVGMVATSDIAAVVAESLKQWRAEHPLGVIVVDPVMVSKGGDSLVDEQAVATIREQLIPLADLITPNLHEAGVLLDRKLDGNQKELRQVAEQLLGLGSKAVLVKGGGGHGPESIDIFSDGDHTESLISERIPTRHTHGTGCTLSAAITAGAALGNPLLESSRQAKRYLTAAIHSAPTHLRVGHGNLPLDHQVMNNDLNKL
jgi:hydroxymethylpyrimidine/phosphomethylpyrimidine kinase